MATAPGPTKWKTLAMTLAIALVVPLLCCLFNPMLLMFLTSVSVENRTATVLHAVPVTRDEGGDVRRAFLTQGQLLAIPAATDLVIPAHGRTSFVFDWDDDNLCWLAVRTLDGSVWKLVRGPEHAACALVEHSDAGCCGTGVHSFTIETLDGLEAAPDWMVRAAKLTSDAGAGR